MAKHKHLSLDERITISRLLDNSHSFKAIAAALDRDCTTISKEIRSHLIFEKKGAYGRSYNACQHRLSCDIRQLCPQCPPNRQRRPCSFCPACNAKCSAFLQQSCTSLQRPPYVCNGCDSLRNCTLEKRFYRPKHAHVEYLSVLSESRRGISLSEAEVQHLDSLLSPLIRQGLSLNHICVNNRDTIMLSPSTLYRFVDYGLFSARNLDLPRKVRYKSRKSKKIYKVDKACRIGRTFDDMQAFMDANPLMPLTQMDSLEGQKGGKVLLTIHFVKAEFMLAFLRDANDSASVTDIFQRLYLALEREAFTAIMPLLLGDNGSEFSNPKAIEFDQQGNRITHVFYCDPAAPYQKGSMERNHEFIRLFIPKGRSLDSFTQEDISLMMSHINSYSRPSLGNRCPYEVFAFLYGQDILDLLGCSRIPANDVTLNASVFR